MDAYETILKWREEIESIMHVLDSYIDSYENNMRLYSLENDKLLTIENPIETGYVSYNKARYLKKAKEFAKAFNDYKEVYEKTYKAQCAQCNEEYKNNHDRLNLLLKKDPSDVHVMDLLVNEENYINYQNWLIENKYNKTVPSYQSDSQPGEE